MKGRIENKIKTEDHIKELIQIMPKFINKYYYSLNSKSHTTKLRYITNVIRFLNYYFDNNIITIKEHQLKEIDSFVIEQYMESINYINGDEGEIKELSANSKAIIYSSLSSFFAFLKNNKYITESPFENQMIERPRIEIKDVVFLTPEEVKNVEATILNIDDDWKYRDILLFRIPVINGLRVTALSEINIEDVDLKTNTIKVVEKGGISKSVYIDEVTADYIRTWMRKRVIILRDKDLKNNALFISNQGKRITVRSIERVIQKYTKVAVPYKHITPHKLRSTCGTNLYQAKKDIYLVAKVLGHKSTAPTQRYTCVFEEDKQDAINTVANLYS